MTAPAIDYRNTGIAVRGDIIASQTRAWQSLGAPGTWWTGAERVAIAREVRAARRCAGCAERKAALSPYAVSATHAAATRSPARGRRRGPPRRDRPGAPLAPLGGRGDRGRPHRRAARRARERRLHGDADRRLRARDRRRPAPLPAPVAGDPSRVRPAEAVDEGYFVPTIPYAVGQRPELGLYEPAPFMPNVGRGLSLVPDAVRSARDLMLAHYMKYEQVATDWEPRDRPITRSQMELVASRTSAKNDCFY